MLIMRAIIMVSVFLSAGGAYAQLLDVVFAQTPAGEFALQWGPPIGWSSNQGEVCGDENDEDPTLALIHAGVPAGVKQITFSGSVNVSKLDPALKLAPGLFTLCFAPPATGITATQDFPGGVEGWQPFSLTGNVTTEDSSSWLLIPVFKIRKISSPDDSLAPNADDHSSILIDDLQVKFDDDMKLTNGSFETGALNEDFGDFMGVKSWRKPDCVDLTVKKAISDAAVPGDSTASESPKQEAETPLRTAEDENLAQDTQNFMQYFIAQNPDIAIERVFIPPHDISAFYVYLKAKEKDVKPGVILVHGHNTDKRFLFSVNWPRDLAYMGYAVLAIDSWGHGERASRAERIELEKTNWFDGATKAIQKTIEQMPTVYDYLASQPSVDPKRIALTGVSLGGCITIGTAVIEDRIAAYAPVSAGCDYENWFAESAVFPGGDQLPEHVKARIREFDPIYYTEKIAGKPVRFVHGMNDAILPPDYAKHLYDMLKPLYEKYPERLDWKGHNVFPLPTDRPSQPRELVLTHHTAPGMTQDVFDWLDLFIKKKQE